MSKALFPGTFDPFTIGHEAIVKRTLTFMDEVVIAIVNNMEKNAMFRRKIGAGGEYSRRTAVLMGERPERK